MRNIIDKIIEDNIEDNIEKRLYTMLARAKCRAKKKGIKFDLKREELVVPIFCPVLGLKLKWDKNSVNDCSPSLDRIEPNKGYTKDNVNIISMRANKIKQDANYKEVTNVANWLRGIQKPLEKLTEKPKIKILDKDLFYEDVFEEDIFFFPKSDLEAHNMILQVIDDIDIDKNDIDKNDIDKNDINIDDINNINNINNLNDIDALNNLSKLFELFEDIFKDLEE